MEEGVETTLRDVLRQWEVERNTVKALREQMSKMIDEHQRDTAALQQTNTMLLAQLKGRGVSVATAKEAYTVANVRLLEMVMEKDAAIAALRRDLQKAADELKDSEDAEQVLRDLYVLGVDLETSQ